MGDTVPEPFDINFCFPIRELENDRVKLTPFIPAKHLDAFFNATLSYPTLWSWFTFGPFHTAAAFNTEFIEGYIQPSPAEVLFVVLDKTKGSALAGTIGLANTSPANLSTEIGFVIVFPPFQHTHVTSNAVGLLLHYCLDLPRAETGEDGVGGLGLRRVQWRCYSVNKASIRAAERMGFTCESIRRWDKVTNGTMNVVDEEADAGGLRAAPRLGNGRALREGDPRAGRPGWDVAVLSLCWDDWEGVRGDGESVRTKVRRVMDRI